MAESEVLRQLEEAVYEEIAARRSLKQTQKAKGFD